MARFIMSIKNFKVVLREQLLTTFDKISNECIGIEIIEKAIIEHFVVPSQTLEDYVYGRRVSNKRLIIYWLKFFIYSLFAVKYGFLYLYKSSTTISLMGEFLYVVFKLDLVYLINLTIGISGMTFLIVNYYFTVTKRFIILNLLHELKNNVEFPYYLIPSHKKKFRFLSYLANDIVFRYIQGSTKVCVVMLIVVSCSIAYMDTRIEHRLVNLVLSGLHNYYATTELLYVLWSGVNFTCMTALYLYFSFRQIRQQIQHAIGVNNKLLLIIAIKRHEKLCAMTIAFNDYIKFIIGFLYVFPPMTITLFMTMAIDTTEPVWKRLYSLFCSTVCVIGTYMATFMAAYLTSENESIVKDLYPTVGKFKNNLRLELIIDSFVSKLNTQFIGFYCFNLFRFTKFSFFEYAFLLSSTYFLINKLKGSILF